MASDLNIDTSWVPGVERGVKAFDQLATSVGKLAGTGKALEELRRIMVGVGNGGSALSQLGNSIRDLTGVMAGLPAEMRAAMSGLKTVGTDAGKALGEGVTQGVNESLKKAKTEAVADIEAIKKAVENAGRAATGTYATLGPRPALVKPVAISPDTQMAAALAEQDRKREEAFARAEATQIASMTAHLTRVSASLGLIKEKALAWEQAQDDAYTAKVKEMTDRQAVQLAEARNARNASLSQGTQNVRAAQTVADDSVELQAKAVKRANAVENIRKAAYIADQEDLSKQEAQAAKRAAAMQRISQIAYEAGQEDIAKREAQAAKWQTAFNNIAKAKYAAEMADIEKQNELATKWQASMQKLLAARAAAEKASSLNAAGMVAKTFANNSSGPIESGTYSSLSNYQRVTPVDATPKIDAAALSAGNAEMAKLNMHLKTFPGLANDAHSAARGLASGFGAMFLTWGNIVPLMAGAAISHATVEMIKLGASVEQTTTLMGVLGEIGNQDMDKLNQAVLKLGSGGVFGPAEVAKALKAMTFAGLAAKDQMDAIGTSLKFAQLGEMHPEKAVEVLASIAQAFSYTAKDWGYIGDIITQVAVSTNATIEGVAASFKKASVVSQEYGVSLKDVALQTGLLAQVGVKESAAGTAIQQMYNSLAGATKKTRLEMQQLGIDVMTANKQAFLPVPEMVTNVIKALAGYTNQSQIQALINLVNVRGMKTLVADMAGYRAGLQETTVDENGLTVVRKSSILTLQELQQKIEDAPGVMALAQASMAVTSQNIMTGVKTALESSLASVYTTIQPLVVQIALSMREAFGSESFKNAIASLAQSVFTFTKFLVDHASTIGTVIALYASYRVAALAMFAVSAGWSTLVALVTTVTTAVTSLVAGLRAGSLAMALVGAGFTTLAAPILLVVGLLAAAGAAMYFLTQKTVDATEAHKEKAAALTATNALTLDQLRTEADELEKVNEKRRQGASEQAAQAEVQAGIAKQKVVDLYAELRAVQQINLANAQASLDKEGPAKAMGFNRQLVESDATKRLRDARAELAVVDIQESFALSTLTYQQNRYTAAAKEGARITEEEAAKRRKTGGTADLPPTPKNTPAYNYNQDVLKEEKDLHNKTMQELVREASEEKQILDAKHKALMIGEAAYQSQALMQLMAADQKQLAEIDRSWVERNSKLDTAISKLSAEAGGTDKITSLAALEGPAFEALDSKTKSLITQYKKLTTELVLSNEQFNHESVVLKQNVNLREQMLSIDISKGINTELKAATEFGRSLDVNLQKQKDRLDLEIRMEGMTNQEKAGWQARLAFEDAAAQGISKHEEALSSLMVQLQAYKDTIGSLLEVLPADSEVLRKLTADYNLTADGVAKLTAKIKELKSQAETGGGLAEMSAQIAQARKEADAMAKDLTKSLADAVMKGTAGFKSLWTGLKDWLKQTFSKLILQPMLQPIMQSIANQVVGSTVGGAAGGIAGQTIGAAAGSAALGSAAFSGVGGTLGVGAGGVGAIAGFGSAASYGASALMAGNGLTALSGGYSMMMAGELAQGIGMMAGVVGPLVIAAMALASLDKKATPHVGGYALSDSKGYVTDITKEQGGIQQADTQTAVVALAKSSANLLNTMSAKFGGAGKISVRAVFESDSNDPSWALFHLLSTDGVKLNGSFDALGTLNSDPSKGLTEFSGMAADALRTALKEMNLPQWAKDQLDALGSGISISDLSTAADKINATQDAFLTLTKTLAPMAGSLGQLSAASSDTLYNLATLAGGFDNLTSTLSTYYTNFYSASEQHAAGMANLTAEYSKLNMGALPQTKAAFRSVIDQFVAGGGRAQEGGEKTYLTLMQLANGFASLDTAVDNSKAVQMQADLLRAQGNELGAVAVERQQELLALQATNPELVDLQKQLWGLADAAAAAAKLEQVKSGLDGIISKFLAGPDLYDYKASRIGDKLSTAGINASPDQIINATRAQIEELWQAVGPDGKIAIEGAYQDWQDLMTLIQQTKIDGFLKGLNTTGDELMGAYDKINPKAKNLVQAWEDTTTKIDSLRSSLNSLLDLHMGETPLETALRNLKDLITRRDDLKSVVKSNEDTIYGLKSSQVSQKGVDYLKNLEKNLWASYKASNGDPKIAAELTKVTLDRIKLEGQVKDAAAAADAKLNEKNIQAQKDALQAQIDGYKKLKDMAKELQTYILSLKAGDLSNLSYAGRLSTSKGIFDTSIKGAMSGDATALGAVQGNAQDYLKQAQQFYGGSTKEYSDIFNAVTSSLESVIGAGAGADPMLAAAQAQLDALNNLGTTTTDTSDAQIAALENLNATFGVDVASMSASIDAQAKVLGDQLKALEDLRITQEAAISQAGDAYKAMVIDLDEIAADMRGTRRTAELESASV